MTDALAHYTNPLHVYCRLRDLGLPTGFARPLSKIVYPGTLFLAAYAVGLTLH